MRRFLIHPVASSIEPIEVIADNEAAVLTVLERLNCTEAQIHRDGSFAFSVKRFEDGLWQIYGRSHEVAQPGAARHH